MIFLRNKLYIEWNITSKINLNAINNFNLYIDKINKFKFIVLKLKGIYDENFINQLNDKITGLIIDKNINSDKFQIYGKKYNKEKSKFLTLTQESLYDKWTNFEIIKNEELNKKFKCSNLVDNAFINNTLFYYGNCSNKEYICDLEEKSPYPNYFSKKCSNKFCNAQYSTKTNINKNTYKKDVVFDNNNLFYVKWRLLNACNYHCSYCIRKDLEHTNNSINKLKEYANILSKKINIPYRLELIGGEVTLLDLKSIIDNIQNTNLKAIYISTNLSAPKEYYQDLNKYLRKRHIELSLSCSLHEDECNIDEFLDKIYFLSKKIDHTYLECVATNNNMVTIKKIISFIKRHKKIMLSLDYERDRNDNVICNHKYDLSDIKNIKKDILLNNVDYKHHSEFTGFVSHGMKCKSNSLYIDVDGSVYERSCKQKSIIGNINNFEFTHNSIIQCPNSICNFSINVEIF